MMGTPGKIKTPSLMVEAAFRVWIHLIIVEEKNVMKFFTSGLLIILCICTVFSQGLESRLDSLLQGHVDHGEIHGCIAYIMQKDRVILYKPYGYMDLEKKRVMERDAIFGIASMTKILTAAAALKLYEEEKYLLDDPVKKYIPEFANLRVLAPACTREDSLVTIPLERDITIRDLFRHTAGFGYGGEDVVGRLYAKNALGSGDMTLQQFVQTMSSLPLKYQPGSKWEYSYANDILGYLIEVISGKPLDMYIDEVICEPLKMSSTGFYVPQEKLGKLCNHYEYKDKKLYVLENAGNSRFAKRPIFLSGGGGGVSTIDDYSAFCQMILKHGEYHGKHIFHRQTIELLTSNQIGENSDRSFPVSGFGFGVGVVPGKYCGQTQSCFWAGAPYNTTFFIDFDKQVIAIMLIQNSPWQHLHLMDKFGQIVREEIKE
jgi:CubicO group peptidase (beta-lactamase class C family)